MADESASEPSQNGDAGQVPLVHETDDVVAIEVSKGVFLRELTGRTAAGSAQTEQSSIAHFRLEPGCGSAWSHNKLGEESFFVLSGTGTVWIGNKAQPVKAGSFIVIPADCVRSIRAAESEALEYYALTTPAWSTDDDVHVPAPDGSPV